jgi:hypothetical protein
MLLVPHDGEVWASPVNLQWIMACALPLIASTRPPDSQTGRTNQLSFLFVSGLTGPYSAFSIPLWLVRGANSIRSRCSYGVTVSAVGLITGLVQFVFIVHGKYAETPTAPQPIAMGIAFVERWGVNYLDVVGTWAGWLLFLSLLGLSLCKEGRSQRLAFLTFAIIILAATFVKFYRMPIPMILGHAERYFYIPSVMLMWIALSLAWTRHAAPVLVGGLASLLIPLSASSHFVRTPREPYSDWQEKASLIGKAPVQINYPPGWTLHITPSSRY